MERYDERSLYDAIFHRKSVRGYEADPLDTATLDAIERTLAELVPLDVGQRFAFRMLKPSQLKGIVGVKAPHYLAVYAKKEPDAIVNAAFMMQQVDLWLSASGLGACWLGMPGPAPGAEQADGMPYVIALAFGKPARSARRADTSEFRRKPLNEITDVTNMDALIEPVRLAPSARNRQAWFVTGDAHTLRLCGKQSGMLTKALMREMPMIDMGIALCHLWLSAACSGRLERLEKEQGVIAPRGYDYVWSAKLNEATKA